MQFLRKHQKKMFFVIAIITIVSFTFFGTSGAFVGEEIPNRKIGKAIDGSSIYERDLKAVIQLLSLGASDRVRSDLAQTGALSLLAENYFSEIQQEFQAKLQKVKSASFYSHPQAPFLNAVGVWNRFAPQLYLHLKEVQAAQISAKTFQTYAELYLDQQAFPPELLRAVLLYEQHQYSGLAPDYELRDARFLALFGYQTFEEWFGARFSELVGKFILNTAAIAEKKGYKVSQQEARTDLMKTCYQALKMKAVQQEVSLEQAIDFFRLQLQMAGLDESRMVQLWRKVMLVHRFFEDVEQGVLFDPLPYEQFASFADAKASVDVYELPETLRLKDFRSMLKVQYYLEAVSSKGKQAISDLPRQFYSVEDIEKRHPQLVISSYELEVGKISQEALSSRLSLKETWDFEVSDAGWDLLEKQFPDLRKPETETAEKRLKILDEIHPEVRKKIDRFAKQWVVKLHPQWVEEAFKSIPLEKMNVDIRHKGAVSPFDDIEDTEALREALQKAAVGVPIAFNSPEEGTYYQIKVLKKAEKKEIMTLQKALENDWLGTLLDEKLEAAHLEARKKDAAIYKASDGSWKPFKEVRDHVGAYVYSDLLKAVSSTSLPLEEYASKRFEKMMEHVKQSVQKEEAASKFLVAVDDALIDQWRIVKRHEEVKRSDTTSFAKSELFSQALGSFSSVVTAPGGGIAFFHLLKREASTSCVHDQVTEGQKLMGRDMARHMVQSLIEEIGPL